MAANRYRHRDKIGKSGTYGLQMDVILSSQVYVYGFVNEEWFSCD